MSERVLKNAAKRRFNLLFQHQKIGIGYSAVELKLADPTHPSGGDAELIRLPSLGTAVAIGLNNQPGMLSFASNHFEGCATQTLDADNTQDCGCPIANCVHRVFGTSVIRSGCCVSIETELPNDCGQTCVSVLEAAMQRAAQSVLRETRSSINRPNFGAPDQIIPLGRIGGAQ